MAQKREKDLLMEDCPILETKQEGAIEHPGIQTRVVAMRQEEDPILEEMKMLKMNGLIMLNSRSDPRWIGSCLGSSGRMDWHNTHGCHSITGCCRTVVTIGTKEKTHNSDSNSMGCRCHPTMPTRDADLLPLIHHHL